MTDQRTAPRGATSKELRLLTNSEMDSVARSPGCCSASPPCAGGSSSAASPPSTSGSLRYGLPACANKTIVDETAARAAAEVTAE